MKSWTNKTIARYCTWVLGKPVRAFFVPYEQLGHDAMVHSKLPNVLFYSDRRLPKWIIWHEVGHMATNQARRAVSSKKIVFPRFVSGLACSRTHDIDPQHLMDSINILKFEERIEQERRAQIWAIKEALDCRFTSIACTLIEKMDSHWDSCPVYKEAKRRVLSQLSAGALSH
jgi:hypothetical protein